MNAISRITSRLTYANVVATIALALALSGTAYAMKVNGSQITNRSVTARKIKRATLTGTEINESKLGTVPTASKASSVTVLDPEFAAPSASDADFATARAAATPVTLFSSGVVSVVGKCFTVGTDTAAVVEAATSTDGALVTSHNATRYGGDGTFFLDTTTTEAARNILVVSGSNANSAATTNTDEAFMVIGPDQRAISGQVFAFAKGGTLVAGVGDGAYGAGSACVFGGFAAIS